MHITVLYAALLTLLYLVLTVRTVIRRNRLRVALGDGGNPALQKAIRAHANFAEYVPLALVLLFLVENSGAQATTVYALGTALLLGRLLHALGVSRLREPLPLRITGMLLTLGTLLVCATILLLGYARGTSV